MVSVSERTFTGDRFCAREFLSDVLAAWVGFGCSLDKAWLDQESWALAFSDFKGGNSIRGNKLINLS